MAVGGLGATVVMAVMAARATVPMVYQVVGLEKAETVLEAETVEMVAWRKWCPCGCGGDAGDGARGGDGGDIYVQVYGDTAFRQRALQVFQFRSIGAQGGNGVCRSTRIYWFRRTCAMQVQVVLAARRIRLSIW